MIMSTKSDALPALPHLRRDWVTSDESVPWETAITLGEMSTLAYTNEHIRTLVLRLIGFDNIENLEDGPRSGFVAAANDVAVVAFRGTDDVEDWLANFDCFNRTPDAQDRAFHNGFWSAYNCFAGKVKDVISTHKPAWVWVTGHSLGGAMAACCAFDFIQSGLPLSGLVTFGQPRMGNRTLAQFLDVELRDRYMRFVNETDLVPLAPPGVGIKLPDYWHCGSRIHFKQGHLERWNGLALLSTTGPTDEARLGVPEPESSMDGEDTLTEDEFTAVKAELRKQRFREPVSEGEQPNEVQASSGRASIACHASETGGWIADLTAFIKQRLVDHSMEQYLQQLQRFQKSQLT